MHVDNVLIFLFLPLQLYFKFFHLGRHLSTTDGSPRDLLKFPFEGQQVQNKKFNRGSSKYHKQSNITYMKCMCNI